MNHQRSNKTYCDAAESQVARLTIYMVAFLTGGIVMGFEMLGSRYLNPYFGSGIYTWASLISTVLAALSVGYFVGGWIADRYPSISVLALSVVCGSFYLLVLPMFGDAMLDLVLGTIEDVRVGSLLAAVLLMFWPVTCLGMYTPFAIRLLIRSTKSSGKTSGIIYGISAAGSIVGTLGITFLLIPTIGSRAITLLLGAVGTIGGLSLSALPMLFRQTRPRDALSVAVFLLIFLSRFGAEAGELVDDVVRARILKVPDGPVSHIETEYNDIFITKERSLLTMSFQRYRSRYTESVSDLADPANLPVLYTRVMTVGLAYPTKVDRLLTIGLGGGSVPTYLVHYLGDLTIDNVELDPGVITAAKNYFGLQETERVRFVESDGRVFLNRTRQIYDVMMVDAFRGGYVPFHLLTSEFYNLVKTHLAPDGVVVFNVHTGTKLYASTVKTLRASFPWVDLYGTGEGNIIAVAGASVRPDDADLMQRATALQKSHQFQYSLIRMLYDVAPDPNVSTAALLTDDFAPVNLYDAIQEHNKKQW